MSKTYKDSKRIKQENKDRPKKPKMQPYKKGTKIKD